MPMRVYSEDSVRKRKLFANEDKPPRKYTKSIKEEIKKEPLDLSDNDDDIDGDDVMDIEEADLLPKKGKLATGNKKRLVKKKNNIKKVVKSEKDKEPKEKAKPKRKKKIPPQQQQQHQQQLNLSNSENPLMQAPLAAISNNSVKSNNVPVEPSKPAKKVTKVKEKKVKPKVQKAPTNNNSKKNDKEENSKPTSQNESDTDSPEESDAYETCGVANCQRPSGLLLYLFSVPIKLILPFSTQNLSKIGYYVMAAVRFGITWCVLVLRLRK